MEAYKHGMPCLSNLAAASQDSWFANRALTLSGGWSCVSYMTENQCNDNDLSTRVLTKLEIEGA